MIRELLRLLETALLEAGMEVVRTRAGNRELLQRLFRAGVVVLIEAERLEEFSDEVSIAVPGTDGPLSLRARWRIAARAGRRRFPSFCARSPGRNQ